MGSVLPLWPRGRAVSTVARRMLPGTDQPTVANDPNDVRLLRPRTVNVYDEGNPEGAAAHLLTRSTSGLLRSGTRCTRGCTGGGQVANGIQGAAPNRNAHRPEIALRRPAQVEHLSAL